MKEKLIIKNFGPIKHVELELGRFNVIIGDQGTGKSTVAKVLTAIQSTFFRDRFDVPPDETIDRKTQVFFEYLKSFEIQSYHYDNTYIQYWNKLYYFQLNDRNVEIKKYREASLEENFSFDINYIVAERILVIILENSLYALIETRAYLPPLFLRFGNKFQKARKEQESFNYTNVIEVQYTYKDNQSIIILPSGKEISINEASTGIQGAVSLLTVFDSITRQSKNKKPFLQSLDEILHYLIIEEPELNCFPATQNKLVKYFVENTTIKNDFGEHYYKNRLLITTHSPYILTSINNLMYANNVAINHKEEADKIIEKKYWLNPDDVSVYMILPDGKCEDIFDREEGLIKAEKIDGVTNTLNEQFSELLNLEFASNEFNS